MKIFKQIFKINWKKEILSFEKMKRTSINKEKRMKTSHTLVLAGTLLATPTILAQNLIREKLNPPTWTEGVELQVGYAYESLDIDGLQNRDNHGIALEVNKDFALQDGWITTSAAIFKTTESDQGFSEIDNTSLSLFQRITKPIDQGQMVIYPILGLGVSYGELEYGERDFYEQDYLSANMEAKIKLDTLRGVAPYLSYTYQMANLEDTERDMNIHAITAGVSFVF